LLPADAPRGVNPLMVLPQEKTYGKFMFYQNAENLRKTKLSAKPQFLSNQQKAVFS